jgi:hypothetical protein
VLEVEELVDVSTRVVVVGGSLVTVLSENDEVVDSPATGSSSAASK